MQTISIIGFGRFGQLLAKILATKFEVLVFDIEDKSARAKEIGVKLVSLDKALELDTIFYAVPINRFEDVLQDHLHRMGENEKLIIDVLSVKCHPKQIFEKLLPKNCRAMLTHPLFGPDSYAKVGLKGLKIVMDQYRATDIEYIFWKQTFVDLGLEIIELSAEEHDQFAANSQGVSFFIAQVLKNFGLEPTPIDTVWAKQLLEIVTNLGNDSWELFLDLQTKNPYTGSMRERIGSALDLLYNKLLPTEINPGVLTLGIQGGNGSFNEEAARYYLDRDSIKNFDIKYLYTTENVLSALHRGEIDRGQFAIHNSTGGIVIESIEAMAKYKFKIIDQFAIKITHALMIHKDSSLNQITEIMTHPQVLAQCRQSLAEKYPQLKQSSGEGELVDHSLVAKYIKLGKLPKTVAVMGSKVLAEIYDLKIVEDNLQDQSQNYTSFLQVTRI